MHALPLLWRVQPCQRAYCASVHWHRLAPAVEHHLWLDNNSSRASKHQAYASDAPAADVGLRWLLMLLLLIAFQANKDAQMACARLKAQVGAGYHLGVVEALRRRGTKAENYRDKETEKDRHRMIELKRRMRFNQQPIISQHRSGSTIRTLWTPIIGLLNENKQIII